MKPFRLLVLVFAGFASRAFAADSLDFPDASFRIKIGAQSTVNSPASSGTEIRIDGHGARSGERLSNLMRVTWIVSPSDSVGDEYVFTVKRPKAKARTYSVIFKDGYVSVVNEDDLLIEIEN